MANENTLPPAEAHRFQDLIAYAEHGIASRVLAKKGTSNVTLFAFENGQALTEHTSPFDALVVVLEGRMTLTIGGKPVSAFLRSGASEAIVTLPAPNRPDAADYELERAPVTVRLIRMVTPEGRVRVLATSLLDASNCPAAEFGALYHQRWRVEEAFRRIKHRIDLESVSGLSWLAHQQDLAAKILNDNLSSLLCLDALHERDGHISEGALSVLQSPGGSALLKINRTRAFAHIRQCRRGGGIDHERGRIGHRFSAGGKLPTAAKRSE